MILVLSSVLIALNGCIKQETDLLVSQNEVNLKTLVMNEGTINMEGYMRWYVYAKMEHLLIADPDLMFTMCKAELTFTDKQNFTLHTKEIIPFDPPVLFREMTIKGKITPGGTVMYSWPESWLEMNWATGQLEPVPYDNVVAQVRAHTGYELSGPGVNSGTLYFKGFFDGTRFLADCHANAFQVEPGNMGAPYDVVVDGPILFGMSTELEVVE